MTKTQLLAAIKRALIMALVVGTTLLGINQGEAILIGNWSSSLIIKMILTPLVPFCVSLYSTYLALRKQK